MSTAYAIEVKDLSYRRDGKILLGGIDWKVRKGEHWAILGLNGSGKTTLLNLITGYLWPTTGVISVLGETYGSVDLREMRKSIGWVSSSLQEKLYVGDKAQVVVLSGKYASIGLYDKAEEKDYEQASELMKRLGCSHLWDRTYQTCSQGEKQKLLIARALMANPRLVILDEPCNGLDLFAREQLLSGIAGLAEQPDAPTMLYVTHHTEEILPVFTHALLLRRGEMFATGEIGKLYELPVEVRSRNGRAWLSVV